MDAADWMLVAMKLVVCLFEGGLVTKLAPRRRAAAAGLGLRSMINVVLFMGNTTPHDLYIYM